MKLGFVFNAIIAGLLAGRQFAIGSAFDGYLLTVVALVSLIGAIITPNRRTE